MAYDTTEAVAKFLSGFQMKITNRERDTVAPDYYVKYLLTLSKGGKDFSTTFVSDPRAFGEPTVTQVFSALADDALTLRKYSTDEFVDKLYARGVKPSAALRAYDSCKETNEKQFIHDLYNSPELCAAPRYMEQSFGCPSEEYEKEEGTLPHDFTTGKWRVHLIYPGERYGLDGCLTYELNAYSGVPAAAHRASYPLVEFYDTSQDAARFPGGQFVSRYYMTDLLEDNSIAVSIDTMLKNGNPFSLDGGIPAWTVEGDNLAKVNDFLKKSCMEFCGSLPGDDRGEDGYSLSGEARDAATSRNGLNENRKSVAEMIQECFDSIENNGDAI